MCVIVWADGGQCVWGLEMEAAIPPCGVQFARVKGARRTGGRASEQLERLRAENHSAGEFRSESVGPILFSLLRVCVDCVSALSAHLHQPWER